MSLQYLISIILTITALASYLNYRFIRLPKSIGITLVTVVISLLILLLALFGLDLTPQAKHIIDNIDFNQTFMSGMLSYLLFAGALHINMLELAQYKWLIMTLASVGVLISTLIIGSIIWLVAKAITVDISYTYCLLFGVLISPTDPIMVLNVFKKLKLKKSLEIKIVGESLFNDGMAVVLFLILVGIAEGSMSHHSISQVAMQILQQIIGGIAFGVVLGGGVSHLLKKVHNFEVAMLITLALVNAGYTVAHHTLHVSGVIAIVVAGLMIGETCRRAKIPKAVVVELDNFWELIDEVLTAVLFVLIGMEVIFLSFNSSAWLFIISAIPVVLIARYVSVLCPMLLFQRLKKIKQTTLILMTWAGMRGGISIALAFSLPNGESKDLLLSLTYAVVLFSILVQGLTLESVIKRLYPGAS